MGEWVWIALVGRSTPGFMRATTRGPNPPGESDAGLMRPRDPERGARVGDRKSGRNTPITVRGAFADGYVRFSAAGSPPNQSVHSQ